MRSAFVWLGRFVAIVGVGILAVAVGFRLSGRYFVGDLQVGTVLNGGMAALLLACTCFLVALTSRGSG